MSHRLRPADEPLSGGRGDRAAARRTSSCKDKDGRRPVYGGTRKFQDDPHWRDCVLFYEYFHGDNGAGLGASHQTGWTGIIARTMHLFATLTPEQALEGGKKGYFESAGPDGARRFTGRLIGIPPSANSPELSQTLSWTPQDSISWLNLTALVTIMLSMGLQVNIQAVLASARPARRVALGTPRQLPAGTGSHARFAVRVPGRPHGLGGSSRPGRLPGSPGRATDHGRREGQCASGHWHDGDPGRVVGVALAGAAQRAVSPGRAG